MTQVKRVGAVIYDNPRELFNDIENAGYDFVPRVLPSKDGNESKDEIEINVYPAARPRRNAPLLSLLVSRSNGNYRVLPDRLIEFDEFVERLIEARNRRRLGI